MARSNKSNNGAAVETPAQNTGAVETPEQTGAPEQTGGAVAFKPDKLSYLAWFASLAPIVLAVINMGTKGGKKNQRGIGAVLADIASPELTRFFAYTDALAPYSGLHFSADDIRAAGMNPDDTDSKARALVGKSLADFRAELLKTADSRGKIVSAAIAIGNSAAGRGIVRPS